MWYECAVINLWSPSVVRGCACALRSRHHMRGLYDMLRMANFFFYSELVFSSLWHYSRRFSFCLTPFAALEKCSLIGSAADIIQNACWMLAERKAHTDAKCPSSQFIVDGAVVFSACAHCWDIWDVCRRCDERWSVACCGALRLQCKLYLPKMRIFKISSFTQFRDAINFEPYTNVLCPLRLGESRSDIKR